MHCIREIAKDTFYLGASDRRLSLFENAFPIPRGISYNAYLIRDEKTVLLDTVDKSVSRQFFENLAFALDGRSLDYVVINHMEPDHCATLEELVVRYPGVTIVTNAKALTMIGQFFDFDCSGSMTVKEGDTLETGTHTLCFYMAPMVHWPEAMVTYDAASRALFSADAFGTFGALSGNLFADEMDFSRDWLDDARRYYTNIVGKYGPQVNALLRKAAGLDISLVCPLHGPLWRENIGWYVDKYQKWASYEPEERAVMIAYASVYGDTQNAAEILAGMLAERGVKGIVLYDVSVTHPSVIVSESFRCSELVFASTTYNAGIFSYMETVLSDLKAHNLQNRNVGLIENGSWAPMAGKLMAAVFDGMKNMNVYEPSVTLKSAVKAEQLPALSALADAICASLKS